MKFSILKNNFQNKTGTFSYTKARSEDGQFFSFKTVGFVFVENEEFEIDVNTLASEENDYGYTYTITNNSEIKRLEVDESASERIIIKNKIIKSFKFPNFKDYSPEDGIDTVWGFWADTEGGRYTGVVNPEMFKKNAVFSVEGTKSITKWGEQIAVSSIQVRAFDLNKPEFLLKSIGFNHSSMDWALSNKLHDLIQDEGIKISALKEMIVVAKDNKELRGVGAKTLEKILGQTRALRKEMKRDDDIDTTTKFKLDLQNLLVENNIQGFVKSSVSARDKYLDAIHKGFVAILEGKSSNEFTDRYGVSDITEIVELIKKNPYVLILLPNKGFKTVDALAIGMGVSVNSIERQEACVNGILDGEIQGGFGGNGDIYLDRESLFNELVDSLNINEDGFEEEFTKKDSDILFRKLREDGNTNFYHWMSVDNEGNLTEKFTNKKNYEEEELVFESIRQGLEYAPQWRRPIMSDSELSAWIDVFEHREGAIMGIDYKLSNEQRTAIVEINSNKQSIFCMTGFAGTGKSTVSKAILELLQIENQDSVEGIECLAVSGMASRRINEATGFKSTTITSYSFNPKRIKNTKILFIDEASMVDSGTMASLLMKIDMTKVKIILVGDVGQLPPIGRGTPFKDILNSGWVRSVALKRIFRQNEDAVLTTFAKGMREEKVPDTMFEDAHSDFEFIKVQDSLLYKIRKELRYFEEIEEPSRDQKIQMNLKKKELHKALMLCNVNIKQEVQNLIYKYKDDFAKDYTSFQLIAPQKSTIIGTEEINKLAQDILNDNNIPFIDGDIKIGANKQYKRFKIKDKVIHTKNENWFVGDNLGFYKNGKLFMDGVQIDGFRRNYCHNVGGKDCIRILNGMVGIIDGYDQLTQRILVKYRYEDIEIGVEYQSKDLGSLHLGYCLTIHKLQGSEAKTVALIVSPSHVRMINNNLLYTGITRGKTKGYIVGSKNAFKQGLKKHGTIRQTMLPLLFDGLFWELDDLAKQSIVYDADEWTHGKSEKNLTMCSTKEDFAKFIDLENEAYS
jgi:exodeoxyribonuclease V alpha subunit